VGRDVVITGYGVFTAFGEGADSLRGGVFAGRPAFGPVTRFDVTPYHGGVAAEYPNTHTGISYPPRQRDLAISRAQHALDMAGLAGPIDGAVLMGTQGDFTEVTRFWRHGQQIADSDGSSTIADSVPSSLVRAVAERLQISGPRLAFTHGCVASSAAIIHGCRLIASGRTDMALCGGAYLVDEEFFAKFDSGRAFATDGQLRAFSTRRTGLLLGDGVAMLVLESAESVTARGGTALARIAGWGTASDAYHVCRPEPGGRGLATALRQALHQSAVAAHDVGYVNAHGTGTPTNDTAETNALHAALGREAAGVPVSSTKTTTGHTLEAAGAVEAIITLVALLDGVLPPTAGYLGPDDGCDLDYIPNTSRISAIRLAVSLNSAFGGLNTALLLAAA
jgi:3-oxoacyl-[acyl-carrier-protein] synthase II